LLKNNYYEEKEWLKKVVKKREEQ